MADVKTVSDLPVDVSVRWAKDQEFAAEIKPIIQESGMVSAQVTAEVANPIPQSQLELLLGIVSTASSWANFEPPNLFNFRKRRLFCQSRLVSFIESDEQQDSLLTRVTAAAGSEEDKKQWEEEKIQFIDALKKLQFLNKDCIDIGSRCKQYQKG